MPDSRLGYSILSREEWQAMRYHADVISIVIKKADKGCSVVMWDHDDYKDTPINSDNVALSVIKSVVDIVNSAY